MRRALASLISRRRLTQSLTMPLYRNALFILAGNALTGIVGLVFWMVAAKLHEAATVGLASATMSAMLLLSTLSTVGLDYAIIRFLPNSGNARAMINTSLTVGALVSVATSLIFVAGLSYWSPVLRFLRESPLLFSGFVVYTLGYTLYLIQSRTFVARRRAEFGLAQNVVFNVFRMGLLVLLAFSFGTFGIVSAWGGAIIVALAIGVFILQGRLEPGYRPSPAISGAVLGQLVRYSFTNYIAIMLWTAPGYVLPLLVANAVGPESNAYFYIAWSMANVLFQVPLAVSLSLFAEGSWDDQTLSRNVRKGLALAFLIVCPGMLLFALLGNRLLGYFQPEYADNAAGLLRVLAISAAPLTINSVYFMVERVRMRMSRVIAMNAFVTIATLGSSWVLLPRMGLVGAGIAWIASQSVAALVVVLGFWLRRPQPQEYERQELTQ
jgi:O-antigen/teichoic acid export membrane protein